MKRRDPIGHGEPPFKFPREVRDGEPRSLIDSWPFLAGFAVVVCSLLWAASQGWLV